MKYTQCFFKKTFFYKTLLLNFEILHTGPQCFKNCESILEKTSEKRSIALRHVIRRQHYETDYFGTLEVIHSAVLFIGLLHCIIIKR